MKVFFDKVGSKIQAKMLEDVARKQVRETLREALIECTIEEQQIQELMRERQHGDLSPIYPGSAHRVRDIG